MYDILLVTLVFAMPLLIAAYTDFNEMKIPNKVSLAMFAGFFITLPLHWPGLTELVTVHFAMFLVFFAAGFAMFALGLIGGGDAKLMAATALWFGWDDALIYILYTTLLGAALGIFLLLSKKMVPVSIQGTAVATKLFQGGKDMPYGLALAAGALIIWPVSQIGARLGGF